MITENNVQSLIGVIAFVFIVLPVVGSAVTFIASTVCVMALVVCCSVCLANSFVPLAVLDEKEREGRASADKKSFEAQGRE